MRGGGIFVSTFDLHVKLKFPKGGWFSLKFIFFNYLGCGCTQTKEVRGGGIFVSTFDLHVKLKFNWWLVFIEVDFL